MDGWGILRLKYRGAGFFVSGMDFFAVLGVWMDAGIGGGGGGWLAALGGDF